MSKKNAVQNGQTGQIAFQHEPHVTLLSKIKQLMSQGQYTKVIQLGEHAQVDDELDQAEIAQNVALAMIYVDRVNEGMERQSHIIAHIECQLQLDLMHHNSDQPSSQITRKAKLLCRGHNNLGYAHANCRGDYDKAWREYAASLHYSTRWHFDEERANTEDNVGRLLVALGRHDAAKDWIERGQKRRRQICSSLEDQLRTQEDEILRRAYQDAEYRRALSLISRGEAALAAGDYGKAKRAGRLALRICERLGRQRGIALSNSLLGAAYKQMGDLEKSKKHIAAARLIFTDIGETLRLRIIDERQNGTARSRDQDKAIEPAERDRGRAVPRRDQGRLAQPVSA